VERCSNRGRLSSERHSSIACAAASARRGGAALAIANWITAAALILGAGTWYTVVLGALLATVGHGALVYAAKIDPQFSRVCIRQLRYQELYPARAGAWAPKPARARPTIPTRKEMKG
jgi:type IV secretory pathway TrbD component